MITARIGRHRLSSSVGSSKSRRAPSIEARAIIALVAPLAAVLLAAAACTDEPGDSAPPTEDGPAVVGRAPPAVGGVPSVVMLEPRSAGRIPVPTEPKVMDQFGLAFVPGFLLVRAGQPVEFRNSEDVGHTVRVVDAVVDSTLFNAVTMLDESFHHTFDKAGSFAVSCDIHPGMTAFILVVSSSYAVAADDDGGFSLSGVPPGSYTVTVWSIDPSRRSERVVEIASDGTELILDVTP